MRVQSIALALFILTASAARAQEGVDAFRVKMEKWVETRQLISAEESEWDADKETLRATRDLLAQQKELLEAEITELRESTTAADDEREQLLLERADYQTATSALESQIRELEEEALAITPRLPQPLQDKLEPLLVQIPDDPATTRSGLGQRLMNVLGVLAQAEKFNSTATFVGETRAIDGGQKVQVRTLYWGLGQAIYVDAQGKTAGIGRPGPAGWEFVDDPLLTAESQQLLDIYEGNVDAIEFVSLPVEIR